MRPGSRLQVDVVEVVEIAVVLDRLSGPQLPRDLDVLLHQLRALELALADDIELMLEVARAHAEVESPASHPGHRRDQVRHVDRVSERNDRGRAETDALRHAGEIGERGERLDEGSVRALHAMRVEHEVVAHPERVEAQPVGEPGALDEQVLVSLDAEMRDEQSETGGHRFVSP